MFDIHKHYTEQEITKRCMFCNTVTKQGTAVPEVTSSSVCDTCLPMLWKDLEVEIIEKVV